MSLTKKDYEKKSNIEQDFKFMWKIKDPRFHDCSII